MDFIISNKTSNPSYISDSSNNCLSKKDDPNREVLAVIRTDKTQNTSLEIHQTLTSSFEDIKTCVSGVEKPKNFERFPTCSHEERKPKIQKTTHKNSRSSSNLLLTKSSASTSKEISQTQLYNIETIQTRVSGVENPKDFKISPTCSLEERKPTVQKTPPKNSFYTADMQLVKRSASTDENSSPETHDFHARKKNKRRKQSRTSERFLETFKEIFAKQLPKPAGETLDSDNGNYTEVENLHSSEFSDPSLASIDSCLEEILKYITENINVEENLLSEFLEEFSQVEDLESSSNLEGDVSSRKSKSYNREREEMILKIKEFELNFSRFETKPFSNIPGKQITAIAGGERDLILPDDPVRSCSNGICEHVSASQDEQRCVSNDAFDFSKMQSVLNNINSIEEWIEFKENLLMNAPDISDEERLFLNLPVN